MTDDDARLRRHLRALTAVNHQLHAQLQHLTEVADHDQSAALLEGLTRDVEGVVELVRHRSGAVFVVEGGQRRAVRSGLLATALSEHLGAPREVHEPELRSWEEGPPVEMLVGPKTAPFVVVGGRRLPVRGLPVTTRVSARQAVSWPEGPELTVGARRRDGETSADGAAQLPLPTFLIIGAQKSATRWLRTNLGLHPSIFTADREIEYFHNDRRLDELGPDWYRQQFAGWAGEPIVGEATPGYMMWRHQPEVVARRIHELLPDVRLLAILRNPIDRAYSALLHHQSRGRIDSDADLLTLVRAQPPEEDLLGLVAGGWYAASLKPFLRYFGDQVLVLLHDDLIDDTQGVFAKALAHVGAPPELPPELERVRFSNRPATEADAPAGSADQAPTGEAGDTSESSEVSSEDEGDADESATVTWDADRLELYEYFRADIAALEDLLGRPIPAWHPPEDGS